jgi:hypothetical protein
MPRSKYMAAGSSSGSTSTGIGSRSDVNSERARERFVEALEEINADPDLIESARQHKPETE